MRESSRVAEPARFDAVSGAEVVVRHRESLKPEEGQLVEVAALKDDLVVSHLKEAATAQPVRIAPFEDRPLAILEQILDKTRHLRATELGVEHLPDRFAPEQRLHDYLIIGRIPALAALATRGISLGLDRGPTWLQKALSEQVELSGADTRANFQRDDFGISPGKDSGFDMRVDLRIQVEAVAKSADEAAG
jgi:hypothetical protein